MQFGRIAVVDADGAILAHGVRHAAGLFKKGRVLTAADVATLSASGITAITAARLGPDDVPEDEAARAVAVALAGAGVVAQQAFTGRANVHSTGAGLLQLDAPRIRALNHLHESLTVATLNEHDVVSQRQMVATVKIIPFAVPRAVLAQALALIGEAPLVRVAALKPMRVGLVITRLPQTKPNIIAKSEAAMAERLQALGASLAKVIVCDHDEAALAGAIAEIRRSHCDLYLLFGASAIVDRGDVVPAGLTAAGGAVVHLGMPVDPGNLLMLGQLGAAPVIGVPSCARSPKVNGFDWVLQRALTGVAVTPVEIMDMGVGGLLAEIPTRPHPREMRSTMPAAPRVAAVVLAAGKSSRMGSNKLLELVDGVPLVRRTVMRIAKASVADIVVVTGHAHDGVEQALAGLPVRFVHNPNFSDGLSTSLRAGVQALGEDVDAALVCLGDMPLVRPEDMDRLIAAFNPAEQRLVVVPRHGNAWGNPVLWGAEYFDGLQKLSGDRGARALLDELAHELVEIAVTDDGVVTDVDTPDALVALRSIQAGES